MITEQGPSSPAGCGVFGSNFASMLYELGTEEQKEKYMFPAIQGKFHGASEFSEPQSGSDMA